MKKVIIFFVAVVSVLMSGCLKSVDDLGYSTTTTYRGRVVNKYTHSPIANLQVVLGDRFSPIEKTLTNSNGNFELKVGYNTIDRYSNHIWIMGGDNYEDKELELLGAGKETYDFGTVELVSDNRDYPQFTYAGHNYYVLGMSQSSYSWNSDAMATYASSLDDVAIQLGCSYRFLISLAEAEAFVSKYSYSYGNNVLYKYCDAPFWAYEDAGQENQVYLYSCEISFVYDHYELEKVSSDGSGTNRVLLVAWN